MCPCGKVNRPFLTEENYCMVVDKVITQKEQLDIIGATLLSIEEAKQLPLRLRKYTNWWWLRSSGYRSNRAAVVCSFGSVSDPGSSIEYCDRVVRPALKINNLNCSNLQIGDVFMFGGKWFEVISNSLAFCLEDIGFYCFGRDLKAEDANDYEKSDVKEFIDDWFNRSLQES